MENRGRCQEPGPDPKPVLRQAQDEVRGKAAVHWRKFHPSGSAARPVPTQDEVRGKAAVHWPKFHLSGSAGGPVLTQDEVRGKRAGRRPPFHPSGSAPAGPNSG